jgi:hypothetical protein
MQEDRLQPQSYLHGGHRFGTYTKPREKVPYEPWILTSDRTMRSEPSIGSDQIDVASPNQPLMQRSRQQGIGSVKETQVTYNVCLYSRRRMAPKKCKTAGPSSNGTTQTSKREKLDLSRPHPNAQRPRSLV